MRFFRVLCLLLLFLELFQSPLWATDHNRPGTKADDVTGSDGQLVDMILASIDGDPLTLRDLQHYISSHGEKTPPDILGGSPEVRHFLREMVIEELLAREAKSAGVTVNDDEIQAYIDEIKRQNGVDQQGFVDLLSAKGISLDEYKTQVRSDIIRTRILSSRVRSKINVLDEDIDAYLKEHPARVPESGEIHLEQIFLKTAEGAGLDQREALQRQAQELREKILGGSSMHAAGGENYSDLGFVRPADLRSDLKNALAKLQPGAISQPVVADNGVYLLKVKAGKNGGSAEDEIRQSVRQELMEKRFKEAMDKFLNDELPKKYHVELKL
jgi:parvulin-like peptidyl-prolyl isomerase